MCRLRILRSFLIVSMAVLIHACSKDDEPKSRSFRMGFATMPYGITGEALEHMYDKLSVESDIINHHFDNGVPWVEALSGAEFPQPLLDDWNLRKGRIKTSDKSYVSVTPISHSREGLAAYRGTADNMPLPAPWNTYAFNHENVKAAYLSYCKKAIDFFKPDYFAMSVEANLLYKLDPEAWPKYLELHEYVYRKLKSEYPDLPVFATIAGAPLLKGFLKDNDHVMQRLAAMQLLQLSDYYAISFYPPLTAYQENPWTEDTFDELFALSTKPVIIAETAFRAESFSIQTDQGSVMLATDPVKQKLFVDALLAASGKWKAEFVIWFALCDLEAETNSRSPRLDMALKDAGLYDENGNPRPALNSWREWLKKRVVDN